MVHNFPSSYILICICTYIYVSMYESLETIQKHTKLKRSLLFYCPQSFSFLQFLLEKKYFPNISIWVSISIFRVIVQDHRKRNKAYNSHVITFVLKIHIKGMEGIILGLWFWFSYFIEILYFLSLLLWAENYIIWNKYHYFYYKRNTFS